MIYIGIDPGTTKSGGIVTYDNYLKSIEHYDYESDESKLNPFFWIKVVLEDYVANSKTLKIFIEDCVMGYKTKSSSVNSKLDSVVKQLLQDYRGYLVKKQDWIKLFKGLPAEVNTKTLKPTKYVDLIAMAHLQIKIDTADWSEHERSALCIMIQGISQYKHE